MIEEILNTICEELPESLAVSFLHSYAKIYAHNPDELGQWSWIVEDTNFHWSKFFSDHPELLP